jgi:hypothetical protein
VLGRTLPVVYENPGAHAQLDRVSDDVLAALPPPHRPLWPVDEATRTWQLLRAFSFGFLFVGLAAYLHVKTTVQGSSRLALETNAPWLARALSAVGVIEDLSGMDGELDRGSLYARVHARYSAGGGMSAGRAQTILTALLGGGADGSAGAAAAGVGAGVPSTGALSASQFDALLSAALAGRSNSYVRMAVEETCGVCASTPAVLASFSDLFDRVVAARDAGASFSPAALNELATEIGLGGDAMAAADFLADCGAALRAGAAPSAPLPLTRSEFIEYMAFAASAGAVRAERVDEYLRVFYMLHLSGIRQAAGVRPV